MKNFLTLLPKIHSLIILILNWFKPKTHFLIILVLPATGQTHSGTFFDPCATLKNGFILPDLFFIHFQIFIRLQNYLNLVGFDSEFHPPFTIFFPLSNSYSSQTQVAIANAALVFEPSHSIIEPSMIKMSWEMGEKFNELKTKNGWNDGMAKLVKEFDELQKATNFEWNGGLKEENTEKYGKIEEEKKEMAKKKEKVAEENNNVEEKIDVEMKEENNGNLLDGMMSKWLGKIKEAVRFVNFI